MNNMSHFSEALKASIQRDCERLVQQQDGVKAAVIASLDGFDVASATSGAGVDPSRIAAMASSISAIGGVVSHEALIGEAQSVTVKTQSGFLYLSNLSIDGELYILSLICDSEALLGRIILESNALSRRYAQDQHISA